METRYLISLNYWDQKINRAYTRLYACSSLLILPLATGIYFQELPYVLAGTLLAICVALIALYFVIIWSQDYGRLATYRSVIYDSSFTHKDLLYQLLIAVEKYDGHEMEDSALLQLLAKEIDSNTVDLDDVPKPALIILLYLSSHRFMSKQLATQLIYELQGAIAQYNK